MLYETLTSSFIRDIQNLPQRKPDLRIGRDPIMPPSFHKLDHRLHPCRLALRSASTLPSIGPWDFLPRQRAEEHLRLLAGYIRIIHRVQDMYRASPTTRLGLDVRERGAERRETVRGAPFLPHQGVYQTVQPGEEAEGLQHRHHARRSVGEQQVR